MTSRTTAGAALLACVLGAAPIAAQRGPAATPTKLPADVLALACAPRLAFDTPDTPLRVSGGQDSFDRHSYLPGDLITINAGRENGIEVGQEYYARRVLASQHETVSHATPATIATTGWIRVYAVDDQMSLATITHACDGINVGDHLEPFVLPTVPAVSANKPKPQRDNYGHVMTGHDRRRAFGRGDFFLVDRGSDHGIAPGAQFVLYRNKQVDGNFLYDLGEAVAVDVTAESSTLKVTVSRDAIQAGDLVALRKQP
jgi:hypothetical protein